MHAWSSEIDLSTREALAIRFDGVAGAQSAATVSRAGDCDRVDERRFGCGLSSVDLLGGEELDSSREGSSGVDGYCGIDPDAGRWRSHRRLSFEALGS